MHADQNKNQLCLNNGLQSPPHLKLKYGKEVWQAKVYAGLIMGGIIQGFRIGFNYTHQLSEAKYNLLSAGQNPQLVDEYLSEEIRKGQITEVKPENGPLT